MKEQISASNPESPQRMEHPIFLSDGPCIDADKIRFGHEAYVEAIQDAVAACPTPFVIGLYGKWGTGKTTVLRALKSRLDNTAHSGRHFRVCLFDAWKYSEEASFRRQFLAVLNEQLNLRWDLDKLLYRPKEEQKLDIGALSRNWLIMLIQLLLIAAVVFSAYQLATDLGQASLADALLTAILSGGILTIVLFVAARASDIIKISTYKVTHPLIFAPEQFEEQFTSILEKARVSDARRLAILVDNLDRCAPDAAVDTLRTIKTFLEHEGCVFVVACDEDALIGHLAKEGGYEQAADAEEFLRKFFQTTIRVEQLSQDLRDFASEQVEAAHLQSDIATVVWAASPRDPRRIIQFLNRLSLLLYVVKARENTGRLAPGVVSGNQAYLAKTLWLRERWHAFVEDCLTHADLMELITQAIGRPDMINADARLAKYLGSKARQQEYRGLYEFLELTLPIRVTNPRPFLSLQVSALEMGIADRTIFRDMLRGGLRDEIEAQLSEVTHVPELQRYRNFISLVAEEELNRGRQLEAIQVCRVAIGCFDLFPEPRRDMANIVARTIADAGEKEVILTLEQSSLLRCMAEAAGPFAQLAMARVIVSLEVGSPHTAEFFNALPKHTPELNEEGYAAIASFLLGSLEAMPDVAVGYLTVIAPGSSLANNLFGSKPELLPQVAEGITLPDAQLADKMLETFGDFQEHATAVAMDALCGQSIALLTPPVDTRPPASTQRALAALEHLSMEKLATERIDRLFEVVDKIVKEAPSYEEKLDRLVLCLGIYGRASGQGELVILNTVAGFSGEWPPDKLLLLRDVIFDTDQGAVKLTFVGTVKNRVLAPQTPVAVKEQILSIVFPIPGDMGVMALTDVLKAMLQMAEMPVKEAAARSALQHRDALPRDTVNQLVQAIHDGYMAVEPPQAEPLLGPLLELVPKRTRKELRNSLADRLEGEMGRPERDRRKRAAQHYSNLRANLSQPMRSSVAQDLTDKLYGLRQELTMDDRVLFDIVMEEQDNPRMPGVTWEKLGHTIELLLHSDHRAEIRQMACDLVPRFDKLPSKLHEGILEQLDSIVKDEGLPQELRDAASLAIDHIR